MLASDGAAAAAPLAGSSLGDSLIRSGLGRSIAVDAGVRGARRLDSRSRSRRQRQTLAQSLEQVADVRFVAPLDIVQQSQHAIGPCQQGVDHGAARSDSRLPQFLQDILHGVRQFLDHLAAEKAGAALDRVHGSKQTVDPFAIGIARVLLQRQQILHQADQVFLGLRHEFVEWPAGKSLSRPVRGELSASSPGAIASGRETPSA